MTKINNFLQLVGLAVQFPLIVLGSIPGQVSQGSADESLSIDGPILQDVN